MSAAACYLEKDMDIAQDLLLQALSLAEPEGYIRSFADESSFILSLLKNMQKETDLLQEYNVSSMYVQRIIAASLKNSNKPTPPESISSTKQLSTMIEYLSDNGEEITEPLNSREIEILRLIAIGLSNRGIAEQLILGVNTIRWYVKNIYTKLSVHSRTQAIARARLLNLL